MIGQRSVVSVILLLVLAASPARGFEWDYSYFDNMLVSAINDYTREELQEFVPKMREMLTSLGQIKAILPLPSIQHHC